MAATTPDLNIDYARALGAFVRRGDEGALMEAAALGRRALEAGLGVLDVVQCHHAALAGLLGGELPSANGKGSALEASATFLCESLATFDMAQRG
ncbi:MAG TPA: phosphatase RsbU N-terminal domain-containing protein, partial [Spirochaetia bacterium]|nr:phosphatase RsbU N-terminal domain-containing protein [Spirochaetia bacterium]